MHSLRKDRTMKDQFVDDLFAKLSAQREEAATRAARVTQSRERIAAVADRWWEDFCRVLERKVDAWNAKGATDALVTCTRTPTHSIRLWHASIEAELHLAEARVIMTGRSGATRPRESPFIEFNETRGTVAAVLTSNNTTQSAIEAADYILAPIFTHAFNDSAAAAAG
jgi:hypothetical protein